MKLSFRLLLLFIFLALILPKLLPYLGYRSAQDVNERFDQANQQYDDQVSAKKKKFSSSIESLGLIDPGFKHCLTRELNEFAKMTSHSSGAINDIDELKTLSCEGYQIESIDGIDRLTSLTQLGLARNNIRSLYPLRYHPSLQSIDLRENDSINSIDVLESIDTLRAVTFPRLDKSYCGDAQKVAESIDRNHGSRGRTNISSLRC